MYFKYRFTALHIWTVNRNLTVKTARTQKGRIQNIRAVRCCNDNNAFVRSKAVHLNEQLVERCSRSS